MRAPVLSFAFSDALAHGLIYPRWLPDLAGGYGYPTFVFYQPGLFYWVSGWNLISPNVIYAYYLAFLSLLYLSFLGVFVLAGEFTENSMLKCFAAFVYALTPYIYVNLYIRGAMPELAAMLLTPWPLFLLIHCKKAGTMARRYLFLLSAVLVLAGMVFTHPLVCIFYFPVLLILSAALGFSKDSSYSMTPLCLTAAALVSSALISSPYWVCAAMMRQYVSFENAFSATYTPGNNFVSYSQLFTNAWQLSPIDATSGATIPAQLGAFHFLLAVLGLALNWRSKLIAFAFAAYMLLILLMTPLSAPIWAHLPVLQIVQFPWRILSVTALLQIICLLGLRKLPTPSKRWLTLYPVVGVVAALWCSNQFQAPPLPEEAAQLFPQLTTHARNHYVTATSENEFSPTDSRFTHPRGEASMVELSPSTSQATRLSDSSKYYIHFSVDAPTEADLMIRQYYFPGWKVYLNNQLVPDEVIKKGLDRHGLIHLTIPAGPNQDVRAFYALPGKFNILIPVALCPIVLLLALVIRAYWKEKNSKETEDPDDDAQGEADLTPPILQ